MNDYIDMILNALKEEHLYPEEKFYYLQNSEMEAEKALRATLSEEQTRLFFAFEAAHNAVLSRHDSTLCRQVFLFARALYR